MSSAGRQRTPASDMEQSAPSPTNPLILSRRHREASRAINEHCFGLLLYFSLLALVISRRQMIAPEARVVRAIDGFTQTGSSCQFSCSDWRSDTLRTAKETPRVLTRTEHSLMSSVEWVCIATTSLPNSCIRRGPSPSFAARDPCPRDLEVIERTPCPATSSSSP